MLVGSMHAMNRFACVALLVTFFARLSPSYPAVSLHPFSIDVPGASVGFDQSHV